MNEEDEEEEEDEDDGLGSSIDYMILTGWMLSTPNPLLCLDEPMIALLK